MLHAKQCWFYFIHSWNYFAGLLFGILGFCEGAFWFCSLLVFASCTFPVMLFPPSALITTTGLPNLRQRYQMSVKCHSRKLGFLLLSLGLFFFWAGVCFWSWSKYVPLIPVKTCLCFLRPISFWKFCIKHSEHSWGWPGKVTDLLLQLTKALLLWMSSLPVPPCCGGRLSKHLPVSW